MVVKMGVSGGCVGGSAAGFMDRGHRGQVGAAGARNAKTTSTLSRPWLGHPNRGGTACLYRVVRFRRLFSGPLVRLRRRSGL